MSCARSGCRGIGGFKCTACHREQYCSVECQREDWKMHKCVCSALKKLQSQLQPNLEVFKVIEDTCKEIPVKKQLALRVLRHLITYSKQQFGDRVPGKGFRERVNGESINDFTFEIILLIAIYGKMVKVHEDDESQSVLACCNMLYPIQVEMFDLLKPWSAWLNSTPRSELIDRGHINDLLLILSENERNMSVVLMHRNQYNLADSHCQRALTYARQYEDGAGEKGDQLCRVLKSFHELRYAQGNAADALPFIEEMYNSVAVIYNPAHPKVLEAASDLINGLIAKGDLVRAELFSQMTLASLKDPKNGLNQQSEEVAKGYYDVANVINQLKGGDLVKGEMHIRESLRIRTRLYDVNHQYVGITGGLLARILQAQGKFTDEVKDLFERSIAINIKHFGPDGSNTAVSFSNLGRYYVQLQEKPSTPQNMIFCLRLAQINFKESVRIYTKNLGRDHPKTMRFSASLLEISTALSTIEKDVNEKFQYFCGQERSG